MTVRIAVDGPLHMKLVEYFAEDFSEVGGFNYETRRARADWTNKRKNWSTIEAVDANTMEENCGKLGFLEGSLGDLTVGRPGVDFHAGFNSNKNPDGYTEARENIVAWCKGDFPNITWSTIATELHALSRIFGGRLTEVGSNPVILARVTKEKKAEATTNGTAAPRVRKEVQAPKVAHGSDEHGNYTETISPSGAVSRKYESISIASLIGEVAEVGLDQPTENINEEDKPAETNPAVPSLSDLLG